MKRRYRRESVFALAHDLHALGMQPQAPLSGVIEESEGCFRGNEEQCLVFKGPLGFKGKHFRWLREVIGNGFINFCVITIADLRADARPDRPHGGQPSGLDLNFSGFLYASLLRRSFIDGRISNEVGVFVNDYGKYAAVGVVPRFCCQHPAPSAVE